MKFTVEITEILQKQVIINAETAEKAREIAKDLYHNGDEVLYAEDLKEVTIEVLEEEQR